LRRVPEFWMAEDRGVAINLHLKEVYSI
jgi:hypothetical protein